MTNIYQPPTSDLAIRSNESRRNIFVFQRFSTWFVLALSIMTLNLYAIYWLYTSTKKLNEVVDLKISNLFCQITLIVYFFSYVFFGFVYITEPSNVNIIMGSTVMDLVANILYLVWVYKFRNRLKKYFANENVHIGAIAPFFFLHLFLQFKINELIDNNQHNQSVQPTAPPLAD